MLSLLKLGIISSSFTPASGGAPWSISSTTKVASNKYDNPEGATQSVRMKPDGTLVYYMDRLSDDKIYQRSLSTAWDLTTVSATSSELNVTNEDSFPSSFWIKPDGTKLYIIGEGTDSPHQYTLSTPWDITTASYDLTSNLIVESIPKDMLIDPTGNYMSINGSGSIEMYTLPTPWDISEPAFGSFFTPNQDVGDVVKSHFVKPDGTKLYVQVQRNESESFIYQYALSTAWDLSTATFEEQFQRDNSTTFSLINSMYINPNSGTEMVLLGIDSVIEYYDIG